MKRTVLTFGLISGALSSAMMLATLPFIDELGFEKGAVVGYTAMVLAFLLVFFGIRSFREQQGGAISFGRAFAVGGLITLISCVCYVATWEVIYFKFMPGFGDKWAAHMIEQVRASGAGEAAVQAATRRAQDFKTMYDKPLVNAAMTFVEPLPVGLLMTLVSSVILRRKRERQ